MAQENNYLEPKVFLARVAGKTLVGEYQTGQQWQERFIDERSTVYRDDEKSGSGTTIQRGRFVCFNYTSKDGMSGGCFEIWQRGKNCFDFYGSGLGGEQAQRTVASEKQKLFGQGWTARAWLASETSTCVSEQIS